VPDLLPGTVFRTQPQPRREVPTETLPPPVSETEPRPAAAPLVPVSAAPAATAGAKKASGEADLHGLFLRERVLVMQERHRQAIAKRWAIALVLVALAFVGHYTGALPISVRLAATLAGVNLLANGAAWLLHRAGRFSPAQFWWLAGIDLVVLGFLVYGLGDAGYLGLPIIVFMASGYALGMPRAARATLFWGVAIYAIGRYAGLVAAGHPAAGARSITMIETVFLAVTGWVSTVGPVAHTRRLRRIRTQVAMMEGGDFSGTRASARLDDVGFLAVSLHSMAQGVGALVREIQERSESLAALSDQLAATAQQVAASSESIGTTTGEMAHEAETQRALVGGGAEAVEAAAQASHVLREQASSSNARRLAAQAEAQAQRVGRASQVLVEVEDDYRRLAAAVAAMESAGERVSGFVAAIQAIAEQTRLLALNAAIEAARAGEQGRGFAVVAGEIRGLAAQSATSAAEVSAVVEETRQALGAVRERLMAGSGRLVGVGDTAERNRQELAGMVAGLEETAAFVERLSHDVERQARGMTALSGDMERIREIAERTGDRARTTAAATRQQAAAMEELTATSQQTAETAATLDALANRFRIHAAAAE
jgi:methyl-accepting chemotaxis protein